MLLLDMVGDKEQMQIQSMTHCLATAMALSSFPSEIVLHILSYLPVSSLAVFHVVSRPWNAFLLQYQATIYRHAAFLHGFIDNDSSLFLSTEWRKKYATRVLENLSSWKDLCAIDFSLSNAIFDSLLISR